MRGWRLLQAEIKTCIEGHFSAPPAMVLARLFTLLLILVVCGPVASAQEYTLEQIRKGYLENINRIVTMEVKIKRKISFPDHVALPTVLEDIKWIQAPSRYYMYRHSDQGENGVPATVGCDGRTMWGYEYVRGDTTPVVCFRHPYNDALYAEACATHGLDMYLGRVLSNSPSESLIACSLAMLLESPHCTLVGTQEEDGKKMVGIECRQWKTESDRYSVHIEVWLDALSGFLPRRIRRGGEYTPLEDLLLIDEVLRIEDATGEIWFPKSVRVVMHGVTIEQLQFIDIQLNRRISQSMFACDPPAGVGIVDSRQSKAMRAAQVKLSKKRADAEDRLGASPLKVVQQRRSAGSVAMNSHSTVVATPQASGGLKNLMLYGGVALLVSGLVMGIKSQVSASDRSNVHEK